MSLKDLLVNLLFPKFCQNCHKEGTYLCEDCFSLIEFLPVRESLLVRRSFSERGNEGGPRSDYKSKNLKVLVSAAHYGNFIVKKLIAQFKYSPFVKDLASSLASLIIHALWQTENPLISAKTFQKAIIVPIPLTKKRMKKRGFNQAEEISRELSQQLGIAMANNVLLKTKETLPQIELSKAERYQNVKDAFSCENAEQVKDKTVILVDDVFTTGSTMEEAARVLKENGAKEAWGITVARE